MRSSVRVSVLALAALAAALSTGAPSGAAVASSPLGSSGSVGIRLLDVPLDEAGDPRAKQYIVDNLAPGSRIERRIEVSNTTSVPLRVKMYSDAAVIKGGAFIGKVGHTANELTSWTSLGRARLDVPAGGTAIDTVTVAIPSDAAPGERYAVIWAEVSGKTGGVITEVNRTGIRMYLSVGGDNPATSFTVDTLTATRNPAGNAIVLARVHNTGGRAVDLSGTLSMTKIAGAVKVGPYPVTLGTTLAPGQSEPVTIPIPDEVVDGPWDAEIVLKSGFTTERAHARITFPKTAGASPAAQTRQSLPWLQFTLAAAGVAVLVVAWLLLATARRRRRNSL